MKTLKTLIDVTKKQLDELRVELVVYQEKKDELEQQKIQLSQDLSNEQEFAANNTEALVAYQNFALNIDVKTQNIDSFMEVIDGKIHDVTDRISDMFGNLKKYEILLDTKQQEMRKKLAHKEQMELDEIALRKKKQ